MFIENRVTGGETVIPVPLGLDIVVQYNERGIIQKVYRGFDKSDDISNDIMYILTSNNIVPSSIRIKGGTTWVYGVLHTNVDLPLIGSGKLPDVNYSVYIKAFIKSPSDFIFYACNVDSFAVVFNGGDIKSRAWMTSEKFEVLPAYLIPTNITGDKFEHMVNNNLYGFRFPLIMGLYIYINGVMTYQSTSLYQLKVSKMETEIRDNGDIIDVLHSDDGSRILYVNKSLTNKMGVGKKSVVIYADENPNEILHNYVKVKEPQTTIVCPTCGSIINMPLFGAVQCPDENCPSLLYSRAERLLGVLNLPSISKEKFDKNVKKISDFRLIDIFKFTEYEDVEVEVTLEDALRSVVPAIVLPGKNAYKIFVSKCNFSIESVEYYIEHSDKFWEDLDLDRNVYSKLYHWVREESHRTDIFDVLHNSHIKIKNRNTSAAPMVLQDSLIYITGVFDCGTYEYVSELLGQYGASVTTEYGSAVSCVVIGNIPDNIYGPAIQAAKDRGILIFTESQFFSCFGIRNAMSVE